MMGYNMLNFIPFYTRIWSDKRFKRLSTEGRLLFIYLFANEAVTLTGIYELDIDVCAVKVKLNGAFRLAISEIVESELIRWDEEQGIVFVINRFKLIPNKSPKVYQGAINELNIIKHPFRDEFIQRYKGQLGNYIVNLNDYRHSMQEVDLLNKEQIGDFMKLGWEEKRIKRFYTDRSYPEARIDEVLRDIFNRVR